MENINKAKDLNLEPKGILHHVKLVRVILVIHCEIDTSTKNEGN